MNILASTDKENSSQSNFNTMRRNKKIINWSSANSNELYRFFVEDKLSKIKFNSIFKLEEIDNFKSNIDSVNDVNFILNRN